MNLAVNFAGVSMKNPVTTASGTLVLVQSTENMWI